MKYSLVLALFFCGCTSSHERRGDWMEHLNGRQFTYQPISIQWDRHNYATLDELKQKWNETYEEAIQSCIDRGADKSN